MENDFENYLCSNCLNKSKNCKGIVIIEDKHICVYKCVNYAKNKDTKVEDYNVREYFINQVISNA